MYHCDSRYEINTRSMSSACLDFAQRTWFISLGSALNYYDNISCLVSQVVEPSHKSIVIRNDFC